MADNHFEDSVITETIDSFMLQSLAGFWLELTATISKLPDPFKEAGQWERNCAENFGVQVGKQTKEQGGYDEAAPIQFSVPVWVVKSIDELLDMRDMHSVQESRRDAMNELVEHWEPFINAVTAKEAERATQKVEFEESWKASQG